MATSPNVPKVVHVGPGLAVRGGVSAVERLIIDSISRDVPVEHVAIGEYTVADDMLIFAGSASRKLTAAICDYLKVQPGKGQSLRFSEGTLFVRVLENVPGRRVYLVQSTVFPANDHFMELLF